MPLTGARVSLVAALLALAGSPAATSAPAPGSDPSPAQAPGATADAQPLPPVQVVGERSGPQLWRVSRGDHAVWILGTLRPLPRDLAWQSGAVEEVLASAQEVIPDRYRVDANLGLFSGLRLYLQYRHVRRLPDGATLQQVLAPALYSRFEALRRRYDASGSLEHLQPLFAGSLLRETAIDHAGLSRSADITRAVLKLARRRKVPVRTLNLRVSDARGVLQEAGELPLAAQLPCFDAMLRSLERDLGTLQARAAAWTRGDVATLERLPVVDLQSDCLRDLTSAPRIRALTEQAQEAWLAAVEEALDNERSALALQDIGRLLGPQGWLARLRAAGYTVEGPAFTAP